MPVPGSEFELEADLVLLAMGFTGPEPDGLLSSLDVRLTDRGNVWRDEHWMTSVPGRVHAPATCSAANRSSSGRSPRAAAPRAASTCT